MPTTTARRTFGALVTLAALLLATSAHAQVYKCRIDGQMVFSDQPCVADAKPIDVRPASGRAATPAPGETAAPVSPAAQLKARGDQMERERLVRDLDHRISVEHSRIRDQEDNMARELAALRAKKDQANNNLAGAMWEQSISQEMSAVVARYDVRIRAIHGEIERLQGERERLVGQGGGRP